MFGPPIKSIELGSDVDEEMAIEDREEVRHKIDADSNRYDQDLEDEAKVRLGGEYFFDA